jgi:hypothetical protein
MSVMVSCNECLMVCTHAEPPMSMFPHLHDLVCLHLHAPCTLAGMWPMPVGPIGMREILTSLGGRWF